MRIFGLIGLLAIMCSVAIAQEPEPEPSTPVAKFPVKDRDPSNPFGQVKTPKTGKIEVIGGYALGCMAGATTMPISGKNWEIVRISRNRMYGHPILVDLLKRAAQARDPKNSPMMIGDMSQPRGGPMTSGHTSHQNGLDADIWLQRVPAGTKMTDQLRETIPLVTVLNSDFKSVNPERWGADFEQQILWFAAQSEVERIFVNAAIKKKLCGLYPGDERLKKIRPWYAHDAHFHVRLKCPQDQTACESQKPIEDIDCEDSKFTYWFSNSVIEALKNPPPPRPAKTVHLPGECRDVLAN